MHRFLALLYTSIKYGLDTVVRGLIRIKHAHEPRTIEGNDSPLHIAVRYGREDIVREMLDLGWDIDARRDLGITPLMEAINANSEGMVALLRERRANFNCANNKGLKVTHAALMSDLSHKTVQAILQHKRSFQRLSITSGPFATGQNAMD